jgi:hypothetical protein
MVNAPKTALGIAVAALNHAEDCCIKTIPLALAAMRAAPGLADDEQLVDKLTNEANLSSTQEGKTILQMIDAYQRKKAGL